MFARIAATEAFFMANPTAKPSEGTLRDKLDHFWRILFLNEQGRPKSAMFLYSFCLCLLFFAVYATAFFFLIDVLENAFATSSVLLRNILQSVLPGLLGSLVCCALFYAFPDKRLVPVAYLWLAAFALAALITMALLTEKEEFRIFLYFFAMLVPSGLISGGLISFLQLRSYRRKAGKAKEAC
jgi:hypothetical protein